jgi:hypothetical protein
MARFHYGMPPELPSPFPDSRKLEINYSRLHVQAMLLGVFVIGPILYFLCTLKFENSTIFGIFELGPFSFLGLLAAIIVLHEIIHLVAQPHMGLSDESYFGFLPKSFLAYAAYLGLLSRSRFLFIAAMPFFVITVLPIGAGLLGWLPENLVPIALGAAILNGMASSGDMLISAIHLKRVPRNAMLFGSYYGTPPE